MLDTGFVGQTDREKAIEELSRDCFISVGDARRVVDIGYRKADEVRKETANRFLTTLNGLLDDIEKGSIKTLEELQLQLIYNVHFLRKEFFREVEE